LEISSIISSSAASSGSVVLSRGPDQSHAIPLNHCLAWRDGRVLPWFRCNFQSSISLEIGETRWTIRGRCGITGERETRRFIPHRRDDRRRIASQSIVWILDIVLWRMRTRKFNHNDNVLLLPSSSRARVRFSATPACRRVIALRFSKLHTAGCQICFMELS